MNGIAIMVIAIVALVAGYIFYGRWLAKKWGMNNAKKTPAVEINDGIDYVPTKKQVVFGHQFASIAGAGPINGPIQAAVFGWVPVLLWCLIGGIFIGAVQDFSSMFASVRNKGRSIGIIIENYVGKTGKRLFLLFVYFFSILVVASFSDIVAKSFGVSEAFTAEQNFANTQVACTSTLFIVAAVAIGFFIKYKQPGTALNTTISIIALILCIVLGCLFPFSLSVNTWMLLVFIYILIASVVPVWALLQPRDYLNSYLLIFMIAAAVIGIFVSNPTMELPAFTSFTTSAGSMFPILFVTVACGAVSGFHSLVSSETASKQVEKESDMLPISYGAMLVESLLGVIALIAVGAVAIGGNIPAGTPQQIFATAVSGFLANLGISSTFSYTLISLAVSAFALTSLDSVARVGRLSFQELFLDKEDEDMNSLPTWKKVLTNRWVASIIVLIPSFALAKVGYAEIWALFGSANQLLSVLALAAVAVYLKKVKKSNKMMFIPMFFMLAVTVVALLQMIIKNIATFGASASVSTFGQSMQIILAVLLVALAIVVVIACCKKLFCEDDQKART
ncbi:MAG: carbon starvation protein A [Spirochaetes bacterium]|uniref:Carbon starvation protein A n=1 Tax=Candidatus Ornithospirochaeta stercoripullorum TaxID=2840899 RepID=A0A9D9E1Q5_9SPIO|nr:carbon starvation protein A [Candidatus Ornithospirochaeta stercoripullorum]